MSLQHIPFVDFVTKPWKNGMGTTHDIMLLPLGSDQNDFDLRFALSPIIKDGIFSAFPGIDRVINVFEGGALRLDFGDAQVNLKPAQSHAFDSGLTPVGYLVDGPVKVINVMARRGVFQIQTCVFTNKFEGTLDEDDRVFIFSTARSSIVEFDGATATPIAQDAVLASGAGKLTATAAQDDQLLVAHIRPAT
jgi:environmental stress-induced protein Ves